jgi:predicted nuclease of predicted toxin-antitoxin system
VSKRLLIDNNLSHRLGEELTSLGIEATHVKEIGLQNADDTEIWQYAAANGFHIISKDKDFNHIVTLRGFSPKVIHLDIGNCSTYDIANLLSKNIDVINKFLDDDLSGLLVLMH